MTTYQEYFAGLAQQGGTFLLGIDPGLCTGVALVDWTDFDNPKPLSSNELDTYQFYEYIEAATTTLTDNLHVVIENFNVTDRTAKLSEAPWSLQLKGIVDFLTWRFNSKSYAIHKPADKPFASNDKLRRVGFWHKGGAGHANDAYRHAMVRIVNANPTWATKLMA